ncbi:MAG: stalk domain-containing protein [Lachnospirales bacterium]
MTEEGKLTQNINSSNINGKSAQLQVGSKVETVNGPTVALDIPEYINKSNNSVYVPLIFVSLELVGEDNMMWDKNTKTFPIFKDNKSIKFTVGNNNMIIDGKSIDMGNIISPIIKRRTSICTI